MVAEVEHWYPGLFRAGEISHRYFWALHSRIATLRARDRISQLAVALYGLLAQAPKSAPLAENILEESHRAAQTRVPDPAFVSKLATALGVSERIARATAMDEHRLFQQFLYHPDLRAAFPEEHARALKKFSESP